ncbi:MAG: hypothetical protein DRQ47_08055 [Gammaproteobacteria bacterium]|nr:MAG: hypothetical protein DRQ47_08055 [Gammaproteobacteria bacterium]
MSSYEKNGHLDIFTKFYNLFEPKMTNLLSKLIVCCILLVASGLAYSSAGWTDPGYLIEVQVSNTGRIIAKSSVKVNPSGCRDKELFYIDSSAVNAEQIYKLLLESITSRNQVKLYVTGRCELKGMSGISSAIILSK